MSDRIRMTPCRLGRCHATREGSRSGKGTVSRPPVRRLRVYRFFAGGPFWATAAFTSALNARALTFSPSWMSIALRVLPSKLELKRPDGSGTLAPRANVSFTTFLYASPVQTIPSCDQTGVPLHFHSSVISGSASRISARMRARVSPRHPPRSRIRWSMSREAGFPVIGLASLAPGLAFAPAFGGDLAFVPAFAVFFALAAGLRAPLARDTRLPVGFALPGMSTRCPLCSNEVGRPFTRGAGTELPIDVPKRRGGDGT